jgi:CTP synthase (UTP-ammonia lyase)
MVKIGIIGDFDPQRTYHVATNKALSHAAVSLNRKLTPAWIPTRELEDWSKIDRLDPYAGFLCSPGSPYQSMAGALNGIRFARENDRPFMGT